MDSLGNIWKQVYSGPGNRSALWLLIIARYTKTLTYLLTYYEEPVKYSVWVMLSCRARCRLIVFEKQVPLQSRLD